MTKAQLITQKKLKQFAKNVLDLLEKEDIDSIGSVFSRVGESFHIKGEDHIIQIESRPSESGSDAYTISYIIPAGGIPIEIRINSYFNYSRIFVKTESGLDNYIPVASDYFGNIIQDKKIDGCSIPIIKKELEKLVS